MMPCKIEREDWVQVNHPITTNDINVFLEVRHVILLFVLVSITWLFAGLHLAYGYLWMVILFAIFDVMLVSEI